MNKPKIKSTAPSSKKKPEWRVEGIPHGASIKKHAEELQRTLNDFAETGYSIQVNNSDRGVVVIGRRLEPEPPSSQVMAAVIPFPSAPRNFEVVKPLLDALHASAPSPVITEAADAAIRKYPAERIREAIEDLEKEANAHKDSPCGNSECALTHIATAAQVLKDRLELRVS